jgi:hypothetical protein
MDLLLLLLVGVSPKKDRGKNISCGPKRIERRKGKGVFLYFYFILESLFDCCVRSTYTIENGAIENKFTVTLSIIPKPK